METKIEKTTKRQRAEIVKEAFEISVTGNPQIPSDAAMGYLQEYIDGKTELEAVQKKIIELYRNN